MDDLRFEWLRSHVNNGLGVDDPVAFDELLARDDGEAELVIARYLNDSSNDKHRPLLFYKEMNEEEEEVEIEIGRYARSSYTVT